MYWPILFPRCLPRFSASPMRAGTVSGKQLLTCELLEGGIGLHAEPLAVLIEGLQPQLSGFLDDFHRHVQDMVVYVPTPTDLPRQKHSHALRAGPHCPGKELRVRSPSRARTEHMAQPGPSLCWGPAVRSATAMPSWGSPVSLGFLIVKV